MICIELNIHSGFAQLIELICFLTQVFDEIFLSLDRDKGQEWAVSNVH